MKRDVIFVTISLANMAGGLERNIISIANYLADDHRVQLVTFDWPSKKSFFHISDNVRWHKIATSSPHAPIGFFDRLRVMLNLRRVIKATSNPVIIGFHHGILVRLILSSLGLRRSLIVSERNSLSLYKHISASKWNANFLSLHLIKKITVQIPAYKLDYPFTLRGRIVCIPNAVSEEYSPPIIHRALKEHRTRNILAVGRLCAQKQFDHLIIAFAKISPSFADWRVTILGDGEYRSELLALIQRLGMNDKVMLVAATDDILSYYSEADIFCTTSKWEGFPNALVEAMAMGIPSIGYETCEGVNHLIDNGINGRLVQSDPRHLKLADSLEYLMKNGNLRHRLGMAAATSVEQYHPHQILPKWQALIATC